MKKVFDLNPQMRSRYSMIANFDALEIDCPDAYSIRKVSYMARLNSIIALIDKHFSRGKILTILDIGCAQGNLALILAEKGHKVVAVDIRNDFIEYSKFKYERGDIKWICSNIEDCNFGNDLF